MFGLMTKRQIEEEVERRLKEEREHRYMFEYMEKMEKRLCVLEDRIERIAAAETAGDS